LAVLATLALAACQSAAVVPPPPPPPEAAPLPPPACPRLTGYQEGTASWYGQTHHGRATASGTPFDMNGPTAAHRRLPLRTKIKVTNLENGKSAELLVSDRGPYIRGRVLDVSLGAAKALGFEARGTDHVRIEINEPC
jgi:rare lipoprotein A